MSAVNIGCEADGVAVVTLNRPERFNALDFVLVEALIAALDDLGRDPAPNL